MGVYASSFRNDDAPVQSISHPDEPNWITAHATESGLAIVEVERLWYCFEQLGCNEDGVLTSDVLAIPPASTDVFVKNILTTFRTVNDPDNNITFLTFLNAMTWAESSELETKIRAIFTLVNNGYPITKDILAKVLTRIYPDENEKALKKTVTVVMGQMDTKRKGHIDEDQFTNWVLRMPPDIVQSMFTFEIIPNDINVDAHRAFTSMTEAVNPALPPSRGVPTPGDISHQIPTDNKLKSISQKIHRRDWPLVANKLGLTSQYTSQVQNRRGMDTYTQCFEMLKLWREQSGNGAYAEVLEKALRDCHMNDAAMLLQP